MNHSERDSLALPLDERNSGRDSAAVPLAGGVCRHILSDLDGTLLVESGIFLENIAAVRQWRQSGRQFSIVTGRALSQMTEVIQSSGLEFDFLSCANGAALYDRRLNLIEHTAFPPDAVRAMLASIPSFGANECYIFSKFADYARSYRLQLGGGAVENPQYPVVKPQGLRDIVQISLRFSDNLIAEAARRRLLAALKLVATPIRNGSSLDLVPYGFGKPVGVESLIRLCGIGKAEICTVGDGENDVDMLKNYPSAAIESGTSEALAATRHKVKSVAALIAALLS